MARYTIARMDEISPVDCPCGSSRRALVSPDNPTATMHRVDISADPSKAPPHYHKRLTEMYFVLAGVGHIELDGEPFDLAPGTAVLIKPLCRHRAVGEMQILVTAIPAFDPDDEWFDEQQGER